MSICTNCGDPISECTCGKTEIVSDKPVCPYCGSTGYKKSHQNTLLFSLKENEVTKSYCSYCKKYFENELQIIYKVFSRSIEKEKMEI
ncbi:MAG TPA: hypothetical protein VGB37_05170 [Candidatus Lokiarchaeia archaeon]